MINATNTQKKRAIKYLNQDFDSFKNDIVENHLKVYFPNTYSDFGESNVGMMLVEVAAFVGDALSFYLDKKFQESFIDSAQEMENIFKHAKMLGFKPFGKTAAFGDVDCFISVPVTGSNGQLLPDMRYAGIAYKGVKCKSKSGQTYETLENADFSTVNINDPTVVAVSNVDPVTKLPTSYALRLQDIAIQAGETKTTSFTVLAYQPFLQLTIPDTDVLEIIQVTDSNGNIWNEVDFLAQDTVFTGIPNTGADSTSVPFVLTLVTVPYRFISSYDVASGQTTLTFGTGDAQALDQDLIPNLGDLSVPAFGKNSFTDFSIDPQNFLRTRTMGLAPVNTVLTVQYRKGGGVLTNAGAQQVNTATNVTFNVGNSTLPQPTVLSVANSFSVLNMEPVQGGADQLSAMEIKQLVSANYAAQARCVTVPDYIARALSMPASFGNIFRAYAKAGQINKNSVELSILALDSFGNVTIASPTLKTNLQTYLGQFRMLTDAVEILDGQIINISVAFNILVAPDYIRTDVLTDCLNQLTNFFLIQNWQIGQPINLTDLNYLIADVAGVVSVYDLQVDNLVGVIDGRQYSQTSYNIQKNTQNNIIYCQENSIFALQYPSKDLVGNAK